MLNKRIISAAVTVIGIIAVAVLLYLVMDKSAGAIAAEKLQEDVRVGTASSARKSSHHRREGARIITADPARPPRFASRRKRFFPHRERLSAEQIERIIAFAKEYLPEEYQQIELIKQEDPQRARLMLHRLWWLYRRVRQFPPEIRKAAVERHRLNLAIIQTRRDFIKCTNETERKKLKAKLRNLLSKQFDYDQAVKEWRVKQLEKQIAELKAQIERRKNEKDKIIAERLNRLLRVNRPVRATTRPTYRYKNRPPIPASYKKHNPSRR